MHSAIEVIEFVKSKGIETVSVLKILLDQIFVDLLNIYRTVDKMGLTELVLLILLVVLIQDKFMNW